MAIKMKIGSHLVSFSNNSNRNHRRMNELLYASQDKPVHLPMWYDMGKAFHTTDAILFSLCFWYTMYMIRQQASRLAYQSH